MSETECEDDSDEGENKVEEKSEQTLSRAKSVSVDEIKAWCAAHDLG